MKYVLIILSFISTNLMAQTYKVEKVAMDFETFDTEGINSKYPDFSPVILGNKIIFTSGRESDLVLIGENNWKSTGFLNLFVADIKNGFSDSSEYKNVNIFSEDIANFNHTGPVAFVPSGDTIFYTQTAQKEKGSKEDRHPQLFMAIKKDNKWADITRLPFCQKEFSFGHPSWDAASQSLYFSSDVAGGKGGKDIYRVSFIDGKWGELENIEEINSASDEMFPTIAGVDLFFSSDREGGKGGLDLYWKILNYPKEVENLDQLNTEGDEFGVYVTEDKTKGLYSTGIEGDDNIKYFNLTRSVTLSNEFAGQFTFRNLNTVASGLTVQLFSDDEMVMEQSTDSDGQFKFSELPYEHYTIKAMSDDDLELIVYDVNGNPTTYLLRDGEGAFQYKKIDYSDAGTLSLMNDDMTDFEKQTGWVTGQFAYENLPGEYSDSLDVYLIDEDGNIAFSTLTDDHGNFDFKNIPLDKNYILTTKEIDEKLILFMFDQNGKVIAQLKQNEDGQFVYKKIDPEYANNLQLLSEDGDVFEKNTMTVTGNFNYSKLEGEFGEGLKVYIYDENGFLIDSTITNETGQFRFTGLNPEISYLYKIDESNPDFKMDEFNLYVEDRYGNAVADLYHGANGYFIYKEISGLDTHDLVVKEDGGDEFQLVTTPKDAVVIYFDKNSSYPANEDYLLLTGLISFLNQNKTATVEISAFADCRSTDLYNMYLSEKRGNRIKSYLIRKGVSGGRISVTAYGESKLTNPCGDNADCTEEQHARNRRVEVMVKN